MNRYDRDERENTHPAHPIRNFFYILYSLLNAVAFVAVFFAIQNRGTPLFYAILIGAALLCAIALFVGVIKPLARRKK